MFCIRVQLSVQINGTLKKYPTNFKADKRLNNPVGRSQFKKPLTKPNDSPKLGKMSIQFSYYAQISFGNFIQNTAMYMVLHYLGKY